MRLFTKLTLSRLQATERGWYFAFFSRLILSMRMLFIILCTNFSVFILYSQKITVRKDLHSPLGIPLELSATFGDIRPNHFHMGMDFRTNGKEGIPIYSIKDGYVSRIKISRTGYGRVIYIAHPNGLTSVYAHCSAFEPFVLNAILPTMRKLFVNEIDTLLPANAIKVKKGELIACSGNSGNSTGPHLHFEIRNTRTENALNPLKHGFYVEDSIPPVITHIKLYAVDENGFLFPGIGLATKVLNDKNGTHLPKEIWTVDVSNFPSNARLGFSLSAHDVMNTKGSSFGLYETILVRGNDTLFHSQTDEIDFDETRYVNDHHDYREWKNSKIRYNKCFYSTANPLDIYNKNRNGLFIQNEKDTVGYILLAKDMNGNACELKFKLRLTSTQKRMEKKLFDETYLMPFKSYLFSNENVSIKVDSFTLYEPIKKDVDLKNKRFLTASTPLQNTIHIQIPLNPNWPLEKQYLAIGDSYMASKVENGKLVGDSKSAGVFSVHLDTIAPKISAINFKVADSLVTKEKLVWKMTDAQTDIISYGILVEGKWFPLEYDLKNNWIVFKRDSSVRSEQNMDIWATDACGNTAFWCGSICFSELQP